MIPVPIVTVNHDGVKLMIRSLQCHPVVQTSSTDLLGVGSFPIVTGLDEQCTRPSNEVTFSQELPHKKVSHPGTTLTSPSDY